jgi:hypothetical protein
VSGAAIPSKECSITRCHGVKWLLLGRPRYMHDNIAPRFDDYFGRCGQMQSEASAKNYPIGIGSFNLGWAYPLGAHFFRRSDGYCRREALLGLHANRRALRRCRHRCHKHVLLDRCLTAFIAPDHRGCALSRVFVPRHGLLPSRPPLRFLPRLAGAQYALPRRGTPSGEAGDLRQR